MEPGPDVRMEHPLWNISDTRRDLILRGAGVGNAMLRAIDAASKLQEWAADPNLDSDLLRRLRSSNLNELSMGILPASDQILARRDFHQYRTPNDPNFPSDMGLASRAWETQFTTWLEMQPGTDEWNRTREDLRSIVKAYRRHRGNSESR